MVIVIGKNNYIAIILAAGQGSRMQSKIAKQYMTVNNKPLLYYSLSEFEKSEVNRVILVVGKGEEEYCKKEIVDRYGFSKVSDVISGGTERYLSVYNALQLIKKTQLMEKEKDVIYKCEANNADYEVDNSDSDTYVLIHDGARPLITQSIIRKTMEGVRDRKAVIVAVPTKDTIKIVDEDGYVKTTPKRSQTYIVQTPQAFEYCLISEAYTKIIDKKDVEITDDAMVVEYTMQHPIAIVEGSYKNLKVTTPEDISIVETLMS